MARVVHSEALEVGHHPRVEAIAEAEGLDTLDAVYHYCLDDDGRWFGLAEWADGIVVGGDAEDRRTRRELGEAARALIRRVAPQACPADGCDCDEEARLGWA